MAQVRKMNNGGSVPKLKYGSIIKNGTKYEMDEETMKRLEQYIAAADPDIQQSLADDWNLLKSGQDVTIDTFSNQRSTKPSDFSEGQMRRLGKDKPTESRWHGRFNTDIHKYNKATQYLGTFDPSKVKVVKEETPKTKLGPGSSKFEYVTNDDGTKSYRSLPNTDEMRLFDDIAAYLAGDEAYRANYDVSGWAGFNDLDTWYKGLNNPDFLKNLRVKILNGQELSTDETDYLNTIGLGFDITSNTKAEEQKADAELKAAQDKAWADFNVGNLWSNDLRGNQFYYDSNNNTYKINSEFMPLGLPTETRGFYFNEDFVKNNPGYDWLLGKVYFNDKWYNESELSNPTSRLYAMLNSLKYYDKNKSGDQAGANSILTTYWGDLMVPSMSSETSGYLGDFYQNPNYKYIPLNYNKRGATYKGYNIPENYSIVKRMDLSENNIDPIGRRSESYIMLDPYGNVVTSIDGLGPIQDALNYSDFVGLNDNPIKIQHLQQNESDEKPNIINNQIQSNNILDSEFIDVPIKKLLGRNVKGVFEKMPMSVYTALTDSKFLNNVSKNPYLKDRFEDLLLNIKYSPFRPSKRMSISDWKRFGLQNPEEVIQYFNKYYSLKEVALNPPNWHLKKGGILKGKYGMPTPVGQTPSWKIPQSIETPYSKELDKLFKANTKMNPEGMITNSNVGGLNINYTPTKSSLSPETEVDTETPYTPPLFGSWPVDRKEFSMMPEAINQMFSLGRFGWDLGTNNALEDIKRRGLIDLSNTKMASRPQEIYSRQTNNAGDADRELANRRIQNLPPLNADYFKYAAMKRAGDDAAAIDITNGIRKESVQQSENLAKQIEEQRMYANMRNQIDAHNRGIQAAKMAGLSELAAARTQANRQSFANYLLEKQTEFDQNRGKMEEAILAENRLKWQEDANKGFEQDLQNKFGAVYNAAADKGNLTINQWLSIHPEYANEFNEIKKKWQRYVTDSELSFTKSQNPAKWMFKSGGSLRSASEQIKINKHKVLDQNWVNSNKSVRKAIDKMSDRVHRIIMKILSDEI